MSLSFFLLAVSHSLSCHIELLHYYYCLLWLLAFSHCLSSPLLHVSLCLFWWLAILSSTMELLHVSHCLL